MSHDSRDRDDAEPGGRAADGDPAPRSARLPDADHLREVRPADRDLARVLSLVRHLRRHCPWDARQTPRSLRPYLLEEAEEVADAVSNGDDLELRGELGDLLLNVAFQVVLAEERGSFDAPDVVGRLERKMEERHPHVYGDADEPPPWEAMKAGERGTSVGGNAAGSRPAEDGAVDAAGDGGGADEGGREPLARAVRALRRASRRGFDWPDLHGPLVKVREEADEVERLADSGADAARLRSEVGDLLLAAVSVARAVDVDPGLALLDAVSTFRDRWGRLLEFADERGLEPEDATLEELAALWERAKGDAGGGDGSGG